MCWEVQCRIEISSTTQHIVITHSVCPSRVPPVLTGMGAHDDIPGCSKRSAGYLGVQRCNDCSVGRIGGNPAAAITIPKYNRVCHPNTHLVPRPLGVRRRRRSVE